ncbi:hypothetical protein OA93_23500 [Flavobacterium sp. KMS]|nr:hypothetical protein OA93_23500 [Flavobacterium sp. KMS]
MLTCETFYTIKKLTNELQERNFGKDTDYVIVLSPNIFLNFFQILLDYLKYPTPFLVLKLFRQSNKTSLKMGINK